MYDENALGDSEIRFFYTISFVNDIFTMQDRRFIS